MLELSEPHRERYVIEQQLGRGAFGMVFCAYDRDLGTRVAMKTLNRTGLTALYRFKREFRALADLYHPKLVSLYELFQCDDSW